MTEEQLNVLMERVEAKIESTVGTDFRGTLKMKMKYPLPNENARCLGSNCDKKQDCQRYLTIEIDTKDYMWHGDFKKELKQLNCDLFIDWRNAHEYEH